MAAACRTLIVDDDEDMRVLARMVIEAANEGLQVTGEAADGVAALDAFRRDRPDVVLLDQRMAGLDGLEVAELILTESPGQPIILFSAHLDAGVRDRAEQLGVRACLPKDSYQQLPDALWRCAGA